jgi:RNA polymerase sigma-70 factor (ECF subfamily)
VWFIGVATVIAFLEERVLGDPGHWRMVPVMANGQLGYASYARDGNGCHHAHGITLCDIRDGQVSRIVAFLDAALVPLFGLPAVLRAEGQPAPR